MADGTTTSLKLDPAMKDRVKRLADLTQRSPHWLMKQAIEQYVEREEKREALRAELESRAREYDETGLHLTFEEVDDWLSRVANGEQPPLPEAHT